MSKLIIITAPSGGGKTTIVNHLLSKFNNLSFSVSATTRKPRPGEEEGKAYYFLEWDEFDDLVKEKAFVEWELIYPGQRSGTLKKEVQRLWNENLNVLFDIEVKGAKNIKKMYPDALAIFIKPPTPAILFERLRNRKTEDEKSLRARIQRAKMELTYEHEFDKVLINDVLEVALQDAEQMVRDFLDADTTSSEKGE
jgi:guanylate kinase